MGIMTMQKCKAKIMLVYQAGIANVFLVDCFNMKASMRKTKQLYQDTFITCQVFARGCGAMGAIVRTAHCNRAGDILGMDWSDDLDDAPFSPLEIRIN
jgi:hypothetical protein